MIGPVGSQNTQTGGIGHNGAYGTTTAPSASVVSPVVVESPHSAFWRFVRAMFTDRNGEFDLGAILVGLVVGGMTYRFVLDAHPDYQAFGTGVGAVLLGFAGYKFGDAQRLPPPMPYGPPPLVVPMGQIREGPPGCP